MKSALRAPAAADVLLAAGLLAALASAAAGWSWWQTDARVPGEQAVATVLGAQSLLLLLLWPAVAERDQVVLWAALLAGSVVAAAVMSPYATVGRPVFLSGSLLVLALAARAVAGRWSMTLTFLQAVLVVLAILIVPRVTQWVASDAPHIAPPFSAAPWLVVLAGASTRTFRPQRPRRSM